MKRKSCDSQIKSLVDGYANRSDATGMNLNELKEFKDRLGEKLKEAES